MDELAARGRAAVEPAPSSGVPGVSAEQLEAAGLTPDMVNHPPHYGGLPCGVEVIEITEHLNFNRGNAVKYLLRAGKKGDAAREIEDLRKAAWYASREADRLEGGPAW
jgi:hypothetical protein